MEFQIFAYFSFFLSFIRLLIIVIMVKKMRANKNAWRRQFRRRQKFPLVIISTIIQCLPYYASQHIFNYSSFSWAFVISAYFSVCWKHNGERTSKPDPFFCYKSWDVTICDTSFKLGPLYSPWSFTVKIKISEVKIFQVHGWQTFFKQL